MNIEERLRRRLDALAPPSPGAALEARVRAAHRRRVRRLAAGMAALALAALVPWLVLRPEPGGDPPTAGAGPALGSMDPADASRRQGQVQAIDLALQAAYDHGASDDEIDALWRARAELLVAAAPSGPARRRSPP